MSEPRASWDPPATPPSRDDHGMPYEPAPFDPRFVNVADEGAGAIVKRLPIAKPTPGYAPPPPSPSSEVMHEGWRPGSAAPRQAPPFWITLLLVAQVVAMVVFVLVLVALRDCAVR